MILLMDWWPWIWSGAPSPSSLIHVHRALWEQKERANCRLAVAPADAYSRTTVASAPPMKPRESVPVLEVVERGQALFSNKIL